MTRRLTIAGCEAAGRCTGRVCRYYVEPPDDEGPLCTLHIAQLGPQTLDTVGAVLGISRERVRQIEAEGLRKLASRFPLFAKTDASVLAESWSSGESPIAPDNPYDRAFKRDVTKSYNRIVKGVSS